MKYNSQDKNIVFLMSMFLLFTNYLLRLFPLCHANVASRNGKHFPQKASGAFHSIVLCDMLLLIISASMKIISLYFFFFFNDIIQNNIIISLSRERERERKLLSNHLRKQR